MKLGVAYRSQIKVNHSGAFTTNLPVPLGAGPTSPGEATIVFPPSLTMGIAYSRFKPFTFEFDTTWTGWSSYDKLKVNLDTAGFGKRSSRPQPSPPPRTGMIPGPSASGQVMKLMIG